MDSNILLVLLIITSQTDKLREQIELSSLYYQISLILTWHY